MFHKVILPMIYLDTQPLASSKLQSWFFRSMSLSGTLFFQRSLRLVFNIFFQHRELERMETRKSANSFAKAHFANACFFATTTVTSLTIFSVESFCLVDER